MLFMSTYTFEPEHMNEVIKRRLERGSVAPEGIKVIGEWVYPGALKGFMLSEASNAMALVPMFMPWTDLMKFETVPVVEAEEVLKAAKGMK
jgi:hypothetical protein